MFDVVNELREKLEAFKKLENIEKDVNNLITTVEEQRVLIIELQQTNEEQARTNEEQARTINEQCNEIANLKKTVKHQEQTITRQGNEIVKLKGSKKHQSQIITRQSNEIKSLKQQVTSANDGATEARREYAEARCECAEARRECAEDTQKYNDLRAEFEKYKVFAKQTFARKEDIIRQNMANEHEQLLRKAVKEERNKCEFEKANLIMDFHRRDKHTRENYEKIQEYNISVVREECKKAYDELLEGYNKLLTDYINLKNTV